MKQNLNLFIVGVILALGSFMECTSASAQTLIRSYNPSNGFHASGTDSFGGAGYRPEGVQGYLSDSYANGLVPFMTCVAGPSFFNSTDRGCEGQGLVSFVGWIAPTWGPGWYGMSRPLYRCWKNGDHMLSSDQNECTNAGYQVEGLLGYSW